MRVLLQRLAIPVVLLGAFIASNVAADRFGNDELTVVSTEITTTAADTPVFSIRRVPELLTSPQAADDLNAALDAWASALPSDSCFVVSAGAERIYSRQADLPLTPASNLKLLTAITALEVLGPDFTFETTVAAIQAPDENGLLQGDLYILGGGDPVVMSDLYAATLGPSDSQIRSSADTMADQTIATNIADISGAVVVIENRYDTERAPSTATQEFLDTSQIGSLSAAMFDRGFLGFREQYLNQADDPPPPLTRATDPAAEFASNFDDLLEERNVRISASARSQPQPPGDDLIPLLRFQSPPLSEIVEQMLVGSDNTTAESLVKELGFVAASTTNGSTTAGLLELTGQLDNLGLSGALVFDGSGISPDSKVTCSLLNDLLNSPAHRDDLRAALPVAGQTGTLAEAFIGTPGEGRLRAKTGSLSQSMALSGYFTTDPGVELTFSLIVNVTGEDVITPEQITAWQRPLPALLAPYPAGPALEILGPIGAPVPVRAPAEPVEATPTPAAADDPAPADDPEPAEPTPEDPDPGHSDAEGEN